MGQRSAPMRMVGILIFGSPTKGSGTMSAQLDLRVEEVFESPKQDSLRETCLGSQTCWANLIYHVAGRFEQLTIAGRTKPPQMGFIHSSLALIIPSATNEHQQD